MFKTGRTAELQKWGKFLFCPSYLKILSFVWSRVGGWVEKGEGEILKGGF